MMKILKVAIADDHPVVRKGVSSILSSDPGIEVTAEYESASGLMGELPQATWEALVLDINLRDGNGVELTQQIVQQRPNSKVLILSIYPEEQYALRAMKAGAMGYLNKESIPEKLVDAVLRIGSGKRFISEALADLLARQALNDDTEEPHHRLSDREFQVLCLLAAGKGNQEIASHLFVSTKTVSTYRSRILVKLGLETTADLIRYALNKELLP